jgi:hypothetical protein
MTTYVYIQGPDGKAHAFREGHLPDEVRPFVWRVRTRCGQQLDAALRTFLRYMNSDERCRHCFPPGEEDSW